MQKLGLSSAVGPQLSQMCQTTHYELGSHQKSMEQSLDTAAFNCIELAVIVKERFHMQLQSSFVPAALQWNET